VRRAGCGVLSCVAHMHALFARCLLCSVFRVPLFAQVYLQKLLDEWILVQRTWLYLEPIFGSEDIMRQMPLEGRRFASVDSLWRKTMAEVNEDSAVMTVAVRGDAVLAFPV
jgi:hypothetical protein